MHIKITHIARTVSIDTENLIYTNFKDLYLEGNGCGLQVKTELEHKRDKIMSLCNEISSKIYELDDMLKL
jgi:hypothetical protein